MYTNTIYFFFVSLSLSLPFSVYSLLFLAVRWYASQKLFTNEWSVSSWYFVKIENRSIVTIWWFFSHHYLRITFRFPCFAFKLKENIQLNTFQQVAHGKKNACMKKGNTFFQENKNKNIITNLVFWCACVYYLWSNKSYVIQCISFLSFISMSSTIIAILNIFIAYRYFWMYYRLRIQSGFVFW